MRKSNYFSERNKKKLHAQRKEANLRKVIVKDGLGYTRRSDYVEGEG